MASGNVTIQISSDAGVGVVENVNLTVNLTGPIGVVGLTNLTTTPVQLPIPAGASYLLIIPPAGNTNTLYVGGSVFANMATLDTVNPSLLSLPDLPAVWLAAAAAITGVTVAYF